MAIALVGKFPLAGGYPNATSTFSVASGNTTGCNLLFAYASCPNNAGGTLTDSKGNTYTRRFNHNNYGVSTAVMTFDDTGTTSTASVGTGHKIYISRQYVTLSGAGFSGTDTTSGFDSTKSSYAHCYSYTHNYVPGGVTPTNASSLIVSCAPPANPGWSTISPGAIGVYGGAGYGQCWGYNIQSGGPSYVKPVFSSGLRNGLSANMIYKPSGGGGGATGLFWLPTTIDRQLTQNQSINTGTFVIGSGAEFTKFPEWIPKYPSLLNKISKPNEGWITSGSGAGQTAFPAWKPQYCDILPPQIKRPNEGSVTFNPRTITPVISQQLTFYPDKLLAVPTIFPAGFVANPTPQTVVIPKLSWLPTFLDIIPPKPLQINQGWIAYGSGAGATRFPAFLPTFADSVIKAPYSVNQGYYSYQTGAGRTVYPAWQPSYPDKALPIVANPNTGFIAVASGAGQTTYPAWQPNYSDSPIKPFPQPNIGAVLFNPLTIAPPVYQALTVFPDSVQQPRQVAAEFITNVLYGVAPPIIVTQTGGHYVPTRKEIERWKKHLKAQEDALRRLEHEKINKTIELRKQIDEARGIVDKQDIAETPISEVPEVHEVVQLKTDLFDIEQRINELQKNIEMAKWEARKFRDEEDILTILMAIH